MGSGEQPYALATLAGQIRAHGHTVTIVDTNIIRNKQELVQKIAETKAHLIGITGTTVGIQSGCQLARTARYILPNSIVVAGGVHVTAIPKLSLQQFPILDIICMGEGDITVLDLIDVLEPRFAEFDFTGTSEARCAKIGEIIAEIQGLCYRGKGEAVIRTPARPLIQIWTVWLLPPSIFWEWNDILAIPNWACSVRLMKIGPIW